MRTVEKRTPPDEAVSSTEDETDSSRFLLFLEMPRTAFGVTQINSANKNNHGFVRVPSHSHFILVVSSPEADEMISRYLLTARDLQGEKRD